MKHVYCEGCAKLFHTTKDGFVPLCMDKAFFRHGPLRSRVDVMGVRSAELVNQYNDCRTRRRWSYKATQLKKWLLWRMNNGNQGTIEEADINDYPIKAEIGHIKTRIRKSDQPESGQDQHEEAESIREEAPEYGEETVVDAGGTGNSIGAPTTYTHGDSGQLVLDLREHDGSERSDVYEDDTGSDSERETPDSGAVVASS